MKIYNKKGFISGVSFLLVCILGIFSVILKGISVDMVILVPLLLIWSVGEITRSFSKTATKEDLIKNDDERNKYINLKTSHKSLQILRNINMAVMIVSMFSYAVTKNIFLLGIFVLSSIYFTLNFVVELATNIYYEKHE